MNLMMTLPGVCVCDLVHYLVLCVVMTAQYSVVNDVALAAIAAYLSGLHLLLCKNTYTGGEVGSKPVPNAQT